jgi:CHAT domain-containing protein
LQFAVSYDEAAKTKMYHKKKLLLIFAIYAGFACCNQKSNRHLPLQNSPSSTTNKIYRDSINAKLNGHLTGKKYDAVLLLGKQVIEDQLNNGQPDSAMVTAKMLYNSLKPVPAFQKELFPFLFGKKEAFEKDSAAVHQFYNFFTGNCPYDYFVPTYDITYVGIAEYFISLQKKIPFLDPDQLLGFFQNLGTAYNIAGDLKKAIYYRGLVYSIDRKDTSLGYLPLTTINFAIALTENRQYDSVISISNFAFRKRNITPYEASGLYNALALAWLYKGNKYEAEKFIGRAEQAATKLTNIDTLYIRLSDTYRVKTEIAMTNNQFSDAVAYSVKGLNYGLASEGTFRTRSIGKILLQTGAAYKKLNQPDSALWYFHQALYTVALVDSMNINSLPTEKGVYAENTMMDALDSIALMWDEQYTQTKNTQILQQALQARQLAALVQRKLLEAYSYDESMKTLLLQSKKRTELALQNCYTLWQNDNQPKWVQAALQENENSKAIVLLHSVKRNNILGSRQENDSSIIAFRNNRYNTIVLERELYGTTDKATADSIRKKLENLNEEYISLDRELKTRFPAMGKSGIDTLRTKPGSLKERILLPGNCLLQYFVSDSGMFVLWMDGENNEGIAYVKQGKVSEIEKYISQCTRSPKLFEKDTAGFFALTRSATATILPQPVIHSLQQKKYQNLIVLPDGIIGLVPFDALVINQNQFLINQCRVSTGYSLNTLLFNRAKHLQEKDSAIVFTPFNKRSMNGMSRLAFSKSESQAISEAHKNTLVFEDADARINRFRNALAQNNIIHIASHAAANDSTEPRIIFGDSVLYMMELYAATTLSELIVLSGCETGIGKLDGNEGALSLARGFYYAGAKNVVNSLWQIDDSATANIFGSFYKNYKADNTGAALQTAKINYMNTHQGSSKAPYYWAGLIHTGLDEMNKVHSKRKYRAWITGALLTMLLLFLYTGYRKRTVR